MNIRPVDASDLNILGYLIEDLYKLLQCEIDAKVYVLKEDNLKSFLIIHNDKIYLYHLIYQNDSVYISRQIISLKDGHVISVLDDNKKIEITSNQVILEDYQNGINQLLTYMPKYFFGLNCAVLFCYEDINNKSAYQMAFPYRMDLSNPYIQANWLHDPAYIVKMQGNKKITFEYCRDDTDPFIYDFQMLKSLFCNGISALEVLNEPSGFYIKKPFKLGRTYSYQDVSNILNYLPFPSKEILDIFNKQNDNINKLNKIYNLLLDYQQMHPLEDSKIYIRK